MKLTQVLLRFKPPMPGGHLWRGKYRLYRKVTPRATANQRHRYELEEQNMFYLRHPFLTLEEAQTQTVPLTAKEQKELKKLERKLLWKEPALLGDRFGFLKVSDKWE